MVRRLARCNEALLQSKGIVGIGTKAVTSAAIACLGDVFCQTVLERGMPAQGSAELSKSRADVVSIDWKRLSNFTILGGVLGDTGHDLQSCLSASVPGPGPLRPRVHRRLYLIRQRTGREVSRGDCQERRDALGSQRDQQLEALDSCAVRQPLGGPAPPPGALLQRRCGDLEHVPVLGDTQTLVRRMSDALGGVVVHKEQEIVTVIF
eukprot:749079-Hanusia_phi.AAC.3